VQIVPRRSSTPFFVVAIFSPSIVSFVHLSTWGLACPSSVQAGNPSRVLPPSLPPKMTGLSKVPFEGLPSFENGLPVLRKSGDAPRERQVRLAHRRRRGRPATSSMLSTIPTGEFTMGRLRQPSILITCRMCSMLSPSRLFWT
jgi:hypothetical protein